MITHAHINGVNGAILQALAVFKALSLEPPNVNTNKFIDEILEVAEELEKEKEAPIEKKENRLGHTFQCSHVSPLGYKAAFSGIQYQCIAYSTDNIWTIVNPKLVEIQEKCDM